MKEVLTVVAVALLLAGAIWQWRNMNRSTKLGERRRFVIPLDAETGSEAVVILPWDMTRPEWGQFLDVVMTYERGVVRDAEPELEVDEMAADEAQHPGWRPKDQPARGRGRRRRFQGSGRDTAA